MAQAKGVLPWKEGSVIKDPRAEGSLVLVTLDPSVERDAVLGWLTHISSLAEVLWQPLDGVPPATIAVGFSPSFFSRDGNPRFQPAIEPPAGFADLPETPGEPAGGDVLFYVMSTSEAVTAAFLAGLDSLRPPVSSIAVERGYQRTDGTEAFGYKDGVRNVARRRRSRVAFVNWDDFPEEPRWTNGGTYLAYMRIRQDVLSFDALGSRDDQDMVMGRRRDGSRLDQPPGTDAKEEGEMPADVPPPASHVRKAGPRGQLHDRIEIFRRGLPFLEVEEGRVRVGLQFVSFQASLAHFEVIFNRWMRNPTFPSSGAGEDQLFVQQFAQVEKSGFYFVPPRDERFIGATMFDPAPRPRRPTRGRLAVRKRVLDANGQVNRQVELGGLTFRVIDSAGTTVGAPFVTNSAGHANSPDLEIDVEYRLREDTPPPPLQPVQNDIAFRLTTRRQVQVFENQVPPDTPYA